jgi:hypothetical protein
MGVNQCASWWPTHHLDLLVFVLASSSVIAIIHIRCVFPCAASVFAFQPCFLCCVCLFLPLKQFFFGAYARRLIQGEKGSLTGSWKGQQDVAGIALQWPIFRLLGSFSQCSELLLFFDLVYHDKPQRTSAQIKIGHLQLHGVNSLSWN